MPNGATTNADTCFYCKSNPSNTECAYKHELYLIQKRTIIPYGYKASSAEIEIPRCEKCARKHDRFGGGYGIVFVIIWALLFFLIRQGDLSFWQASLGSFFTTLLIVAVPYWLANTYLFKMITGIPAEDQIQEYPQVKEMLEVGWLKDRPDPSSSSVEESLEKQQRTEK